MLAALGFAYEKRGFTSFSRQLVVFIATLHVCVVTLIMLFKFVVEAHLDRSLHKDIFSRYYRFVYVYINFIRRRVSLSLSSARRVFIVQDVRYFGQRCYFRVAEFMLFVTLMI